MNQPKMQFNMPDSDSIIDRVIQFLTYQKDVYGDFDRDLWNKVEIEIPKEMIMNSEEPQSKENINISKQTNSVSSIAEEEQSDQTLLEKMEQCQTLDELHERCQQADFLKTDLENTNLVFGVGNPQADLVIIGEAPGRNEDIQQEPFVGRAGQLLNDILKAIHFKRSDVYITNIVKHRPPNNRDPLTEERKRSLPVLLKQIDLINPKLILCLGRISAQTLLNTNQPMKALRGSFHPFRDKYELMVTYHPAALLRNPQWKRATWEDVKKLRDRYDELGCEP